MNQFNRKCLVCGGRATGFNYGGLSCESCKVFFHRNSNKQPNLSCDRSGHCAVNQLNRRYCAKCRMDKCLLIGMRRRREEINSNADLQIQPTMGNDLTNIAQVLPNLPKSPAMAMLNSFEVARISKTQTASSVFLDERNCQIVAILHTKEEFLNLHNLWHELETTDSYNDYKRECSIYYIRKTINFCQNFAAFSSLNKTDQMILLKSFVVHLMSIRFTFIWDFKKGIMPMVIDGVGLKAIGYHGNITREWNNQDTISASQNLSRSLYNAMENDIVIRDLISAMCLFRNHQNISSPEIVRYNYFLFTQLLLRYLEFKYQSKKIAKRKCHNLVTLLEEMPTFSTANHHILKEFDQTKLPEIMLELHDLV